ncbi:hypothetical protein ACFXTO_017069 [Malus domestica]
MTKENLSENMPLPFLHPNRHRSPRVRAGLFAMTRDDVAVIDWKLMASPRGFEAEDGSSLLSLSIISRLLLQDEWRIHALGSGSVTHSTLW